MSAPRTHLFAGGGSGGHLFPGLAVAEELRRRDADCRCVFVGSQREVERRIVADSGDEHRTLSVEPSTTLRRNPFRFAWRYWRATRDAQRILSELQPDVVVGLGGFASVPVIRAAKRTPVVLLEQNAVPGRATRWLQRRASVVCASFPGTERFLRKAERIELTGNPVRAEIAALAASREGEAPAEPHDWEGEAPAEPIDREGEAPAEPPVVHEGSSLHEEEPRRRTDEAGDASRHDHTCGSAGASPSRTLLVLGGSQGAVAVNDAVLSAATTLKHELARWRIVHQTGERQADHVRRRYAELGLDAVVEPFFRDLVPHYRTASLCVSRAGATSLAELACAGVPAVLLPYPGAIHDHQTQNAEVFRDAGAAWIVEQEIDSARTAESLTATLRAPLADAARLHEASRAIRRLARPDAAARVADLVEERVR